MARGGRKRSWSDDQLLEAVKSSRSIRMVLQKLLLVPAGGNYDQVNQRIQDLCIDNSHFKGHGWNKGTHILTGRERIPTIDLLVKDSRFQSHKLKIRLFDEGYKEDKCEICGWRQRSKDGRIPLELDHINGIHSDNRLINLRILCPNCHSLQETHRGRNKNKN